MTEPYQDYGYRNAGLGWSHAYLLPKLFEILDAGRRAGGQIRIFELGCGNGSVANELHQRGFQVVGIDTSDSGIRVALEHYPHLKLDVGSAYDDLASRYGQFPVVLSLEVIEHLYYPRKFARAIFDMLESGGTAIISTPYHGYWKNLALALTGKLDAHFSALWDGGHIKFWSVMTLTVLLEEAGFRGVSVHRVGRIPALAKSMLVVARKP